MSRSGSTVPTPVPTALRRNRERLSLRGELALAALPTITVLAVLALVDRLAAQRLLFASLASSAFLIYLDPEHATNRVRALVSSQLLGAGLGWLTYNLIGGGVLSAGIALVVTILAMILLDVVHPPAIGTAMAFALRAGKTSDLALFTLAVAMLVALLALQRAAVWMLRRFREHD